MSWIMFRTTCLTLDVKKNPPLPAAVELRDMFREIYSCFRYFDRMLGFSDVRFLYQSCKRMRLRAGIYAMLRLLHPAVWSRSKQDYVKCLEAVHTDAAVVRWKTWLGCA
jgi:hypothetical protein